MQIYQMHLHQLRHHLVHHHHHFLIGESIINQLLKTRNIMEFGLDINPKMNL